MSQYEDEELWEMFVVALQTGKIKVMLPNDTVTKDINDVIETITPKD